MNIGITKGQAEAQITEAIVKFEREYMGRGPEESKTYIIEDIVIIRLQGVLTPAEKQLSAADSSVGRSLIKQVRRELLEKARNLLEVIIQDVLRCEVRTMHTDISTTTGERVIIFTLGDIPKFKGNF